MKIRLRDSGNQKQVLVICKYFKEHWPDLQLHNNNFVEVTGILEKWDSESGVAQIVVHERGGLYVPRPGFNWKPTLAILVAILAIGFLWVTTLRRTVRQRTRQLSESKARFMAVYQSVPIGIIAVDRQKQIFGNNPAFAELLKLSPVMGESFSDLCDVIGRKIIQRATWDAFLTNSERPRKLEVTLQTEGAPKTQCIEILVEPIVDEVEEGEIWLFRDVTEQRELQRSLSQARKLEAIGQLTGGIAHDFNNALTSVVCNLSLLDLKLPKDSPSTELQTFLQGAIKATDHAVELIRRLLDYSKQSPLKVVNISINDVLRNLFDIVRPSIESNVDIRLWLDDDLLPTQADPVKLEQVFINLIFNAAASMPDGGVIEVTTANQRLLGGLEKVTVHIRDTGCGIPSDIMSKIFDPYFTTKAEKGSGLGLSGALAIVEQHGGKLTCRSKVGEGSTFEVVLPANREPVESLQSTITRPPSNATNHTGSRSVVVIDDHSEVLEVIRYMLSQLEYRVFCFQSGNEALKHIHSVEGNIDLVISDDAMPGMSGIQVYEEMRQAYPDIPFIVCSGLLIDLDDYGLRTNGVKPDAFIEKPLRPNHFNEIVCRVVTGT